MPADGTPEKPSMQPIVNDSEGAEPIRDRLTRILEFMQSDLHSKLTTIRHLEQQVTRLTSMVVQKDEAVDRLERQLEECRQTNEGTRQLMNKLLNDVGAYQRDLSWYKRTFENRSLMGIIKDKFFKRK